MNFLFRSVQTIASQHYRNLSQRLQCRNVGRKREQGGAGCNRDGWYGKAERKDNSCREIRQLLV